MTVILSDEHARPFFIVPEYKPVAGNFTETESQWIQEVGPVSSSSITGSVTSHSVSFSTPPISSSLGKFITLFPRHNALAFWNKDTPFPSNTMTMDFYGSVNSLLGVPWDPLNIPSVVIGFAPEHEFGYFQNFSHLVGSSSTLFSFIFTSNWNPTVIQKLLIRIDVSGRMRILMDSMTTSQARYFHVNPTSGVVVGDGEINTIANGSVGIFDNAVEVSESSFFWDDGRGPDAVLARSWWDQRSLDSCNPGIEGKWSLYIPSYEYDLTFIRNECQPITHGPFQIQT